MSPTQRSVGSCWEASLSKSAHANALRPWGQSLAAAHNNRANTYPLHLSKKPPHLSMTLPAGV